MLKEGKDPEEIENQYKERKSVTSALWTPNSITDADPYFGWEGHYGPIYSVVYNNDGTKIASGGWGYKNIRIYDVSTTDVEEIKNDEIKYYELSQNYPNPFNPSTNIKYSIPKVGNLTLKVFDVLGQEIRTLVSAKQTIGEYEVKFDASNLPSGVYFYRLVVSGSSPLQAGEFCEMKTMLLIR